MELNQENGVLLALGTGVICLGVCYKLFNSHKALENRMVHAEQRLTGVEHKITNIDYRVSTVEASLKATQESLSKIYPSILPNVAAAPMTQQAPYTQPPSYAATRMPL